ncbi:MAG TPA: gluconeogenesis factor YvcK family protein [Patescibacteria group bacterium]|nr:gluconeogenesis factor YvcK family protein [Patescibacteria group bacterium]
MKKKVVVMGGGNGAAVSLVALKNHSVSFDISSVTTMSDDGGSTGALRKYFKVLPPGDIMRAVLAMSKYSYPLLKRIFYKNRISGLTNINKKLKAKRGPNIGNLFITLVALEEGDFVRSLRALEEVLESVGHAYPATLEQTYLVGMLSSGKIVKGEINLSDPTYPKELKIKKVWLEPDGQIYPGARQAILEAEYIVIGPGELFTSLIASLLPKGVKEAIKRSKAKIIFNAGNAHPVDGEHGPDNLSEMVKVLEEYLPRSVDLVVYNSHELTRGEKAMYRRKGWGVFKIDLDNLKDRKVVGVDYERTGGGLCSDRLGEYFKKSLK